jgi:LysM repeat protein
MNSQPKQNQENLSRNKQVNSRPSIAQVQVIERRPAARSINWGNVVGFLLLSGAILLPIILALLVGGFFAYYQVSGRIIPGVKVASSDVGGMLITEAALQLEKTWNLDNQIVVTNGMQTLSVTPAELGLRLDALSSVQHAYQVGHIDTTADRFGHFLVSLIQGWAITPVIEFDPLQAKAGLEKMAPQLSRPARNASIQVNDSQLSAIPGEIGYTIQIEEILADLENDPFKVLQDKIIQLRLLPVSPQISDLTPILDQAEEFIHYPASFRAYDALSNEFLEFPISRETLIHWLSLEIEDQQPALSLDEARIKNSLQEWQSALGDGRYFDGERFSSQIANAVKNKQVTTILISHSPSAYTIQPGDTLLKIAWKLGMPFWKIIQANPGLDPDLLLTGSVLNVPSKDEMLPLPVVFNKRIVISIQKQRLRVYQDGSLISEHSISTGIDRSPTQPGIFQVQTHEKNAYASVWDLHMPHFIGIYEAWPGFMNGIHGLPTLSNGQRLWANILGRPASYGCIIMTLEDAKWLYTWAEAGVVVEITP